MNIHPPFCFYEIKNKWRKNMNCIQFFQLLSFQNRYKAHFMVFLFWSAVVNWLICLTIIPSSDNWKCENLQVTPSIDKNKWFSYYFRVLKLPNECFREKNIIEGLPSNIFTSSVSFHNDLLLSVRYWAFCSFSIVRFVGKCMRENYMIINKLSLKMTWKNIIFSVI